MCQQKGCKYIEIVIDEAEKKKWFIHYKIVNKYFLKEIYREEAEYDEINDSSSEDNSNSDDD